MNILNGYFSHLTLYSLFFFFCIYTNACTPYSGGIDGNSFCIDGIFVSCRDQAIKHNKKTCNMNEDDVYQILNDEDIKERMLWCYRKSIQDCKDDSTAAQQNCYPSQDYTIVIKIPLKPEVVSIQGGNDDFKQCVSEEIKNFSFGCYGYGSNKKFTKTWHFDKSVTEEYEAVRKIEFTHTRKTKVFGVPCNFSGCCQFEMIDSVFRQHDDDIYDCYLRAARNSRFVYGEITIRVRLDTEGNIFEFLPSENSNAYQKFSYFQLKDTADNTNPPFSDEFSSCLRKSMSQWDFGTKGTECSFTTSWEVFPNRQLKEFHEAVQNESVPSQ